MRIAFDVDGVLADFNTKLIERVIEITGEDKFPPRPFDIPTWHYPQVYGYSEEVMDFNNGPVWRSIKEDVDFWRLLPDYEWTPAALSRLDDLRMDGHDIYFVTDRPGKLAKMQTELWLLEQGYPYGTVLLSSEKALVAQGLKLDYYIDDKFENAVKVAALCQPGADNYAQQCKTFLLNRPWNTSRTDYLRGVHQPIRVDSPLEMLDAISLSA